MNDIKENIINRALLKNKKICLPEDSDDRIKGAKKKLKKIGFNIIDLDDLEKNKDKYLDIISSKIFANNWTSEMKLDYVNSSLNLSLLALDNDDIDCVVAGAVNTTSDIIRSAIRIVGLKKSTKWLSSVFFMLSPDNDKFYTYTDCGVIPDPNSEQLCEIAYQASKLHELIYLNVSKVSFLSFSTLGSAKHYKVSKVQNAVELFSSKHKDIIHDGEMQFDAAINLEISKIKMPNSKLAGEANVFVFPDLNSANIAYKITNHLANYQSLGPILTGLNKPVNDLSRGCTVEDIIYISAIAAIQSN
jgi:phosphate acetyltransferase|tara:strand:+ start:8506 stop:9414 length:909 start_codon:yes stop_codon:yes gene_type:complete